MSRISYRGVKSKFFHLRFCVAAAAVLAVASGCGSGISGGLGGNLTPNVVAGVQPASLMLNSTVTMLSPMSADSSPFTGLAHVSGFDDVGALLTVASKVGSTTAASLTSLKYFIQSIRLCQTLDISGSGYSNAGGCIYLYKGPKDNSDLNFYNTYSITEALADTEAGRYVDLMTADGQALLKKPLQVDSSMVGSYKYGMIDFFRPIKVTAKFPAADGDYYTKATTSVVAGTTDSGGREVEYARIGDTSTGPAEETTYMMNNGGAWFPFQTPFEIADSDIDDQTSLSMDLVFNPNDFGKASDVGTSCADSTAGGAQLPEIKDLTNCVQVSMPYVRMNPVPRKSGTKNYKEVYTVAGYETGAGASDLRIELYYNDSNADSVLGIDTSTVMAAASTQNSQSVVGASYNAQTGTIAGSNATVSVQDYLHADSMTGLVRRTNGNLTIKCTFTGGPCTTIGTDVVLPYTYAGTPTLVSSD